jgi:4'-phosphopantetheinyl transferase EntD
MPLIEINIQETHTHIGLWRIAESVDELSCILPTEEVEALKKQIPHPQKLIESLAARALVKEMLEKMELTYGGIAKKPTKAPYLPDVPYQVSISHTTQYATAILHPQMAVGIDIEQARPQLQRVAGRMFSPEELYFANENLTYLALLWSAKETLYKLYAERELHFTRDMRILPFDLNEKAFEGLLFPETPQQQRFQIFYKQIDETHFCTWCLGIL